MTKALAACAAVILMLLAGLSSGPMTARAESLFEKLVSPGDIADAHVKFEKTCESCHEAFSKKSQRRLCLECHKDIAADISGKLGFHGKRPGVATAECKTCHSDHKGRKFDIVQFDAETFNHAFSDFELNGAHKAVQCNQCHAAGVKHRKAPGTCIGCHKGADIHKGSLGENCASCHSEETWKKQKAFDHNKTKFPLEGAHRDVQCAVCHVGERYKDLPRLCVDCHKINDVHQGRFGEKCATCHAASKWKTIAFDHDKNTKFPLRGAHKPVKCDGCHKGDLYKDKLGTACVTCHKSNDPHKGQLGERCETCHNEKSWRQKVTFDHDTTKFPLIGLHAAVPCEECHRTSAYRDTPKQCSACHKDTHHEGRVGPQCQNCHNPNGWALWRFDHNRDTKFALTGKHISVQCHACHTVRNAAKVTAPKTCFGCHSNDDAHRGAFGQACDTCHTTSSFRAGILRR